MKDYDSTLARIAGNVASGYPFSWDPDLIARKSVAVAQAIIKQCQKVQAESKPREDTW